MGKYTALLKDIVEQKSGLDYFQYKNPDFVRNLGSVPPTYEQAIQAAIPHIFDFDYPIFAESYRNVLNTKILKHYYFREIAFETYGQWKMKLDDKLNIIMPYYNQLYESQGLDFDPFNDTDYEVSHTGDIERIGLYKGEGSVVHDGDTTSHIDITTENTKKTDNTDTVTISGENKLKSTTSTDDQGHLTTTKGTQISKDNTGTQMNQHLNHEEQGGDDEVLFNGDIERNGTDNTDTTDWRYFDDTPQGAIDNIEKNGYYTDVTKTTHDSKNTTKSTDSETDSSITNYGKTIHDEGNNTRTDNLHQVEKQSGSDTTEHVYGIETGVDSTNTETKTNKDVFDGNISDAGSRTELGSGTNDFTDTKKDKRDEDIRTSEDWLRKYVGKRGTRSYASLLLEYRHTFLRIDEMILNELEELFFLLW